MFSCTEWEPGERPSLPAILASLTELLPPTHGRGDGEEGGRGRGRLEHQDSLGVVFLSATDSADLTNQNSALGELARQNQGPPSLQQATPPVPLPLQRAPLMPKRSYEDLFLGPDVEAPPTQQEDGTSDNMTKALWSPHLPADEESERTSYNMAIGLQMPSSHRRQYLGEGNAPWPRHKPPSPPYVTPWDVAQQPSQRPRNQHNVPLDSQQQQLVAQEGVRDIAGVLMTGASEEMGRARETERADVTVARETGRADVTVAREVQAQLELAQVQADRQLAEQLQMKEHSFQLTDSVAPPTSVFPPQPLLDTIKSKQFPQLKHVESETTPTESKNNLLKTLKTKKKTSSKAKMKLAKQSVLPAEWNLPAKVATPHHNYSGETLPSKAQLPHSSDHQTIPGRTHHLEHRTPPDKKTVGAMTGRTHPAPPPAPPPPPPPTSRARFMPSPRQLMLKEVKHRAPTVARQLRPVQTIVKRPFRVGKPLSWFVTLPCPTRHFYEQDTFPFYNTLNPLKSGHLIVASVSTLTTVLCIHCLSVCLSVCVVVRPATRDCEIMLNISPIILFLDSQNLSLLFFRNEPIILRLFSEKYYTFKNNSPLSFPRPSGRVTLDLSLSRQIRRVRTA